MRRVALILVWLWAVAAPAVAESPAAPPGPHEIYQSLNALRVDRGQVYYARNLHLRRDVVRLVFTEGRLAFLAAADGHVTGAVFTGAGQAIALPRDPVEKRSLAHFLDTPLLDLAFSRAYLRFTDNTPEELLAQLRAAGTLPINDPSFADEWDPTIANLNPWHSLRILTDRLSAEPQPYFYAGLVGNATGPFDVLVDNRRDEQILLGQPRWANGVQRYAIWASFPRSGAPAKPLAALAPVAFRIETSLLPDRVLEGKTTLHLKALRGGERMISLELSRFLSVQSVTDAAGEPLPFFQNEAVNRGEIAQHGNDSLFVVLPQPVRAGEEVRLQVTYRGSVISDAGNGVYFVGERGSWYPNVGLLDSFAKFDLTFRWPRKAGLKLVATGKKVEEREEGDWRVGRWITDVPIPVAGFNLGEYATETVNVGAFRVELHANQQLEQALLSRLQRISASSTTALRPPPVWPRPATPTAPPPRPVIVLPELPPPSPGALLKELAQDIAEAIRFYEKLHGPFPFEALAVSPIPGAFGQGWPGLLYLPTLSFLPPEAQRRAGLGPRTREQFNELMPFHEVAHQWWGNSVGSGTYRDQWIHEALANYLALLYGERKRPGDAVATHWLERFRQDLLTKPPDGDQTPEEAGPLMLGPRLRSSKTPGAYEAVVYGKGPWVFHMLRMMLRDPAASDPDARFGQFLRGLAENYRHRPLTNEDLQRAVEKVMTKAMDLEGSGSMDWFFDQWVRGTGIPRYTLNFEARPQAKGFLVRGTLKQSGVPDHFVATVPLYARRSGGKPTLLGTVVTSGPETSFQFVTRTRPRRILIDPHLTLLCLTS